MRAETLESHQRRKWAGLSDLVKVVGGSIAALIGLWAAVTTYRIVQLQTRLALIEKERADADRAVAFQARDSAVAARTRAEAETEMARRNLSSIAADIENGRAELAKLEELRKSADISASLRRVSGSLDSASATVSRVIPYVLIVPALQAQEAKAADLASHLSKNGFGASVFRHLRDSRVAPAVTEVRYFRQEDREEGERLTRAIANAGMRIRRLELMYVAEPAGRRKRSFEVRFAVTAP